MYGNKKFNNGNYRNNSRNNNNVDIKKIISGIGTVANVLGKILTTSKAVVDEIQNQNGILYVFDTNALMNDPNLISRPKRNSSYIIPITVLEELDKLKLDKSRSQKASNAIRSINKANVRIEKSSDNVLPKDFDMRNNDNKILATAMKYSNKNVVIVTDDNNLKNKAKSQNIRCMSLSEFKRS